MTRDPADVIEAMLAHVPAERAELRAELERIARDSAYIPPENKWVSFKLIGRCLQAACTDPPRLDWELRIAAILSARTVTCSTAGGEA